MEIVLLERVEKLGQMGDVVAVKPGYARNFLLPQKKALRATKENLAVFEKQKKQLEADNLSQKKEAEKVAAKMDGCAVSLIRQAGESGQLYGSVSAKDIADAVTEKGFTVKKQQIDLNMAIKTLGLFDVRVMLHPEVSQTVIVNVARSDEEAKIQLETGSALIATNAEPEEEVEEEATLEAAVAEETTEVEAAEAEA